MFLIIACTMYGTNIETLSQYLLLAYTGCLNVALSTTVKCVELL